jgi:hypothetical protein
LFCGGASGDGKSDALLAEAVPGLDKPGFLAFLLRRTYPELEGKGILQMIWLPPPLSSITCCMLLATLHFNLCNHSGGLRIGQY